MLIDISRPIHIGMAVYPNNPGVEFENIQRASAEKSGLTRISFGSHTGTHIDALSHIDPNGSGIESFTLDQYIGDVEVMDIPAGISVITAQHISNTSARRIIFKTANSSVPIDEFRPDFVALDESAAEELVRRNVVLVGIDALSIKKKGVHDRVHEILLRANIVIVEGLYLPQVEPGMYRLLCLPLAISNRDGVPARAVLAPFSEAL